MNQKNINLPIALLSMDQLVKAVQLCRSHIYNLMRLGLFMRPVKISERRIVWLSTEVERWIEAKIAGKSDDEIKALVIQMQNSRSKEEK